MLADGHGLRLGVDQRAARSGVQVGHLRQLRVADGGHGPRSRHGGVHRAGRCLVRRLEPAPDHLRASQLPGLSRRVLEPSSAGAPVLRRHRPELGRGNGEYRCQLGRRRRGRHTGTYELRHQCRGTRGRRFRPHRSYELLAVRGPIRPETRRVLDTLQRSERGQRRHVVTTARPGPVRRRGQHPGKLNSQCSVQR